MIGKSIEGVYVDITAKNRNTFTIGSLYRAPNTDEKGLMEHIELISGKESNKPKSELILGMDQNIDLLKSEEHHSTGRFLDLILNMNLWPVITRPTRITQRAATLIDNIYISKNLQHSFDSAIILDNISDHLPINLIHHKLRSLDWNSILNSDDVNVNFDRLSKEIDLAMDSEAPVQTVRISGK